MLTQNSNSPFAQKTFKDLTEMLANAQLQGDPEQILKIIEETRGRVSQNEYPPIDELLQSGILSYIIGYFKEDFKDYSEI